MLGPNVNTEDDNEYYVMEASFPKRLTLGSGEVSATARVAIPSAPCPHVWHTYTTVTHVLDKRECHVLSLGHYFHNVYVMYQ